jgi:hypothetical protein
VKQTCFVPGRVGTTPLETMKNDEPAGSLIEAAFEGALVLAELFALAKQRARVEEFYEKAIHVTACWKR